jgi:hypothetical protein
MVVAHDELRVHKNVSRKHQRRDAAVDEFERAVHREESGHEPENDQQPQRAEQVWHPVRKIIFGLACEERQGDEDPQRDDECLHDDPGIVERGDDADRVGFESGEGGKKEQIRWVAFALPVCQEHKPDRTDKGDDHEPGIRLDPCAVRVAEKGDSTQDRGQKKLDSPSEKKKCQRRLS